MFRTEFHIHTKASSDSFLGKHAILARCKIKHIDCLAITDHNEVSGALEFKSWLEPRGVKVIVGEEIFTSEGEVIGLWLSERISPGLSLQETVAEIKRQGGVVYVPHPYDEKRFKTVLDRDALLSVAENVACVEVHNGRNVDSRYDDMQEIAYEEVFAINPFAKRIVGCDAHCFFEIGRNTVVTESLITRDTFPLCLDKAVFDCSQCHPLAHCTTRIVRFLKMIVGGDFNGVSRVLFR